MAESKCWKEGKIAKFLQITAALAIIVVGAACLLYYYSRPVKSFSWADAIDAAKKSVVVVKSTGSMGSGFFISSDGVIATTSSMIGKDKTVEVRLSTGALKNAVVTKSGPATLDIAILKIDEPGNQFLLSAGPDECRDGEEIRVLGAPQGVDFFVRKGIIVHCNNDRDGVRYLQTDMPFDAASIGGPCIDKKGKVLGLYSSLRTGDAQVLSQVLPMSVLKDFKDGMLTALEDSLIKKEEEKTRELARKQNISTDPDKIYRRLKEAADAELRRYMVNLDNLLQSHAITYEQGKLMAEQVQYGPSGSESVADWVRNISVRVMNEKLTEDEALRLIKEHFKL